jgi:hypothetical protein
MPAFGEPSQTNIFRTLANLSTIYILLSLEDDMVSSDEAFLQYIQSRDRYWHTSDQLSESLMNAEFALLNSIPSSLSKILNDAVQQHHQRVADSFVAAFQNVTTLAGKQRSAWHDFAVFAGSMSNFLRHFATDFGSPERMPISGLLDEFTRIVVENARRFDSVECNLAIERLQCEAKWHQFVADGIRTFNMATEHAE